MNFFKKIDGAVSVFLVIILVPCIFISAMFVDLGRVYLSDGMAYSSADLALNTLLTQYDSELNEYYGLVASCQNIDEFYDVSAEYFLRTISSQNLKDEEIYLLSDQFAAVMGDDSIYDLLKVEVVEEPTISMVQNANLANSTLLKEQVVEFMKYRGPITVATNLIDRIKAISNIKQVVEAEDNEPIVKAKETFYESESELLEAAYDYYDYLYNNYSKLGMTNSFLTGRAEALKNYRTLYEEIHGLAITNLYNTGGLSTIKRPTIELDKYKYNYEFTTVTESKLAECLTEVTNASSGFETARLNFCSSVETVEDENVNIIQYWVNVDAALKADYNKNGKNDLSEVEESAETLLQAYAKMNAAIECARSLNITINKAYTDKQDEVKEIHAKYLVAGIQDNSDSYLKIIANLEKITSDNFGNINPTMLELSNGHTVDAELANIASYLKTIKEDCQTYIDVLEIAVNGGKNGDKTIPSLEDLKQLVINYESNFNTFKQTVQTAEKTQMQEETEAEITELEKEMHSAISETSITQLRTRLNNMKFQLQSLITAVDSMKYGTVSLTEIDSFADMKSAGGTTIVTSNIGLYDEQNQAYAKHTFESLFVPLSTNNAEIFSAESSSDYSLELNPETGKEKVPDLYVFFHKKFKNASANKDKVEETKNEKKDAESKKDEDNSATVATSIYNSSAQAVAANVSGGNLSGYNLGTGITSFVNLIENISDGNIDAIRDQLYLSIYMMEMFSYATYENEGKYQLYRDANGDDKTAKLTSGTYDNAYKSVSGDEKDKWGSTDTTDTYNKSLTNKLINADNNAAYRCEMEYILYGNSDNGINIARACSDIFVIRAALNSVSVFQHFWKIGSITGNTINTVASAASAATFGVIPAAAIKVVILLVLSALETCNDMLRLSVGFPVELYKDKDDWQCSLEKKDGSASGISGLIEKFGNAGGYYNTKEAMKNGLFYSDYITLFVCIGMQNNQLAENMTKRMGDVIETNMINITKDSEYRLAKAGTHFSLYAKLSVDPILISLPIFDEYNGDLTSSTKWGEYNVNVIRGY